MVQSNGKFAVLTLKVASPEEMDERIIVSYDGWSMGYSVFAYARALAQSKDVNTNTAYLLRAIHNYYEAAENYARTLES